MDTLHWSQSIHLSDWIYFLPLLDDGEEKLDIPELGLSIECGLGGNCERNLYWERGGGRERGRERSIITMSTSYKNNY